MKQVTALNEKAQPLLAALEEFVRLDPPPGPVTVRVKHSKYLGSKARGRHIVISPEDVGHPWELGTLAHEYGHVVDPQGSYGLLRGGLLRFAPVVLALIATVMLGATVGGVPAAVGVLLMLVAFEWGMASTAAMSREQEYRADARAARLLGPERVQTLRAMLEHHDAPTKFPERYLPHPTAKHRLKALDRAFT